MLVAAPLRCDSSCVRAFVVGWKVLKDELGHGPDGVQAGRRADHRGNPATAPGFETLGNARPGAAERNFVYQRVRDRSRGFALPSLKVKILNPQCGFCVAVTTGEVVIDVTFPR